MRSTLTVFFTIVLLTPFAYGQFGSGIQGTTLDSTSAVIPGVRIIVTEVSIGVSRETSSSEVGVYRILSLSPGVYIIKAAKEGFSAAEQPDVVLALNEMRK